MAEARSPCRNQTESDLTESEMAAAHQLMHLSDEENSKVSSRSSYEDEEFDQSQSLSDITSAKIEDISGKDEFFRPKKQLRYRSLASVYMETRPMNAGKGKKVRACSKNSGWVYADQ